MDSPHSSSVKPPRSSSSALPSAPQYAKILGADVSQMQEYEARGVRVLDVDGTPKDIFEVLRNHGFNYIRLKTFVSPGAKYGYAVSGCDQGSGTFGPNVEPFGDKDHVVAYAKRAKAAGFKLLLDFHYSDNWADPGKQIIPERWRNVGSSNEMADSVYSYTKDVMNALKEAGALPEMVQIGNEITNGMLREIPSGGTDCWGNNVTAANSAVSGVMSSDVGRDNTAKYLAAGARAVKEFSKDIKTVFHIESPHKTSTMEWWLKTIIAERKVVPDVMAFSAYTAYEHGNPDSWKTLMTNLGKTYGNLEFLIAEYNGAQTKDGYNFDGSRVRTVQIMEQVPRGLGAFIWEPERSGAWGTSMFDWEGNDLKANQRAFDEYKVLF
ncbi:MAG: glycosyl hydrolase 53 family protein [Fibrobacter sp.]|nr:glycosyl hydrolase 53 family protein [Fibrobacter sp.]